MVNPESTADAVCGGDIKRVVILRSSAPLFFYFADYCFALLLFLLL